MALIDKAQGALGKMTGETTSLNAAEITSLQQCIHAMHLGLIKNEFYLEQCQNDDLRKALQSIKDDFLMEWLEEPETFLDKAGVPYMKLHAMDRAENLASVSQVFKDEEIMLDTVLSFQATIMGLEAGALAAVRGDVRDFFINAKEDAMKCWRQIGMAAVKLIPTALPPRMSGVKTSP